MTNDGVFLLQPIEQLCGVAPLPQASVLGNARFSPEEEQMKNAPVSSLCRRANL
jgi:hypothetical protein